jgi:hypothetical protein
VIRTTLYLAIAAAAAFGLIACDGGDEDNASSSPTNAAVRTIIPTFRPPVTPGTSTSAAIVLSQPLSGASVLSSFPASGAANVFESVLFVQLLDDAGKVTCERRVMAASGTGTPGEWTTQISIPPPASAAPATIRAYSRSARDGSEENAVTRSITISNEAIPIVIASPLCDAQVQALSQLDVRGTASVFEAALSVELRDEQLGTVLETKVVTATAGAPETGQWQTTFDLASVPTGAYEIVAYSISARDGSRQNEFAIPIRVTT